MIANGKIGLKCKIRAIGRVASNSKRQCIAILVTGSTIPGTRRVVETSLAIEQEVAISTWPRHVGTSGAATVAQSIASTDPTVGRSTEGFLIPFTGRAPIALESLGTLFASLRRLAATNGCICNGNVGFVADGLHGIELLHLVASNIGHTTTSSNALSGRGPATPHLQTALAGQIPGIQSAQGLAFGVTTAVGNSLASIPSTEIVLYVAASHGTPTLSSKVVVVPLTVGPIRLFSTSTRSTIVLTKAQLLIGGKVGGHSTNAFPVEKRKFDGRITLRSFQTGQLTRVLAPFAGLFFDVQAISVIVGSKITLSFGRIGTVGTGTAHRIAFQVAAGLAILVPVASGNCWGGARRVAKDGCWSYLSVFHDGRC